MPAWLRKNRRGRRLRRRRSGGIWLIMILLLLAVSVAGVEIKKQLLPVSRMPGKWIAVNIPANATTEKIGQVLYNKGLIRSPFFFEAYTRVKGLDGRLRAGEYMMSPQLTLKEIVDRLAAGKVTTYSFTIPEGYGIQQITDLLRSKGFIDPDKFAFYLKNGSYSYSFLQGLPGGENRLEGFLFPATYQITKGATEERIIDRMLKKFSQAYTAEMAGEAKARGLNTLQVITLASIVEKEAKLDSERPVIAGVLYNRLAKGMLLQVDATVQYALGTHRERVLYRDLEVDSPYNTYKYKGLPPGPIASPGLSSIKAVLEPASHDFLYYVAKPDGSHAFSRTLAEHNRAVRQYRP
jgi:UPF0755 protein